MPAFHLDVDQRDDHLLRRRTAVHIILPAARDLKHVTADGNGDILHIFPAKKFRDRKRCDPLPRYGLGRKNEPPIEEGVFLIDAADLIAFGKLVPLVKEAVIRRDQEAMCIRIQ